MKLFIKNEHGFIQYPKSHAGRAINVLRAIITLENPTSVKIGEAIGLDQSSVLRIITKLNEDSLIEIVRNDIGYSVIKWGGLYSEKIVNEYDEKLAMR